ncbi:MAG: DUF1275 domain-containing protein [Alphaproteobacteria bacterium]|nr:DUF1275 domain-containing protein [Alphaproteobacteria bacterium]
MGYITMGGVFAANMTGNTVLAGIDLAKADYVGAWHHLTPLVAFLAGAMLARVLLRLRGSPVIGLLIEAAIIAGVGFVDIGEEPAVMVVALAMGIQASTITSFAGSAISTVVVTSTLARTADAAVDWLWPGAGVKPPSATNTLLMTLTWSGYLVGAVIGAMLVARVAYPLLVPAGLLLVVLLLDLTKPRPTSAA